MKALHERHPKDTDGAVLYAESLMDLRPWRLWADGKPVEGTLEITRVIDAALAREWVNSALSEKHFARPH